MKLKTIIKTILILCISMMPVLALAQTDPDDPGGDPDEVPVDGGVTMLVGAAAVYGARKLKEKRKQDPDK